MKREAWANSRERERESGGEVERKEGCAHILIDVEEGGHGGPGDGPQVRLVPVDTKHAAHILTAGVVTRNILQEEGLLTTTTQRREGERCR